MVKIGKFERILEFLSEPCIEYEDNREELRLIRDMQKDKERIKELENKVKFLESTKIIEIKRNEKNMLECD